MTIGEQIQNIRISKGLTQDIVMISKTEIEKLHQNTPEGKHIKTGDIRKLSAKLYKEIDNKNIDSVFAVCTELLEQHTWELGIIAFDWAYKMKKYYDRTTYDTFYGWLKKYVRGWGDCDDLCTHAFGELLRQDKTLFSKIVKWTDDKDFWVRRASAVVLIPAILHNDYESINPLIIPDRLINDEHPLVQKGYGWMLKSLSQINPQIVKDYLIQNHATMPRTAFRYALEKFDGETRKELMSYSFLTGLTNFQNRSGS